MPTSTESQQRSTEPPAPEGATATTALDAPSPLAAMIKEAKRKIEAGDLEAGLAAFERIAESSPEIPEVFNNLGAIRAAMGRHADAESAFGRAIELTPQLPNPYYNRGLMRFQGGNNLGALADFQRASELDPHDPEFLNNIGVAHFQLEELDLARSAFEQALQLRGDYVAAQLNLVDVELATGHLERAHESCRAIVCSSDDPQAHAKLVECSIELALATLEQANLECEESARQLGDIEALRRQQGRIVRARQVLSGFEES